MNIMFLIFSYQTGGIERLLIDMANALCQEGQQVSLCIINHNYDDSLLAEYHSSIQIYKLHRPCQSGKRLPYMWKLANLIRQQRIQILHCQDLNCTIFAVLAKLLHPSLSIIDTVHDTFAFTEYSFSKIKLEHLLCRKIIAISESVKTSIVQRGIPATQIEVIYNAVDTQKFSLTPAPDNPDIVLGNVARIMPQIKGQQILLDALLILKEKYPHIQCRFAGKAAPEQEMDFLRLKSFIVKHSLEGNITFCGDVKNIPEFLKFIDIFILPSISEGFGISLVEAMSMGIPCIASNIAGPAEIIKEEAYGLLFSSENPSSLAEKIDYMIQHYSFFNRTHISDYIQNNFSISKMTKLLIHLYQSLL